MKFKQMFSPTKKTKPSAGDTIDFSQAMKEVLIGNRIHKLEWEDKGYYGFLNDNILSLHKPDENNYQWIISLGDLEGTDYMVL